MFRQALGVRGGKIDDEADDRAGLVIEPDNADAAHFDQAGELAGRAHQKPAAGAFEMDAIVADQSGKAHAHRHAPPR